MPATAIDVKKTSARDGPFSGRAGCHKGGFERYGGSLVESLASDVIDIAQGPHNTKISSEDRHRECPDLVCCILLFDGASMASPFIAL